MPNLREFNDEALSAQIQAAGDDSGDTCWPMPMDDAYNEQLRSPFVDMGNIDGRPAGAITAACYLSRFGQTGSFRRRAWGYLTKMAPPLLSTPQEAQFELQIGRAHV